MLWDNYNSEFSYTFYRCSILYYNHATFYLLEIIY